MYKEVFIEKNKFKPTLYCGICNEKDKNIAYLPCKHRIICEFCINKDVDRCIECNLPIKNRVKIYNLDTFDL